MDKIKFLNKFMTKATIVKYSENVIKLIFSDEIPEESVLTSGFEILNENNNKNMSDDFYHRYTTVYNIIDDNTVLLSNDGSVYVEPEIDSSITSDSVSVELTDEERVELERESQINNIKLEINELKKQLSETDYIIIKCQEYVLAGKTIPNEYNITLFSEERDSIREKINSLEEELNKI